MLNTVMMIQCLHMILSPPHAFSTYGLKRYNNTRHRASSMVEDRYWDMANSVTAVLGFYTISRYNIIYVIRKIFLLDMWAESNAFSLRYMGNIL